MTHLLNISSKLPFHLHIAPFHNKTGKQPTAKDGSVLSSVPFGKDHSMQALSVAAKSLSLVVWRIYSCCLNTAERCGTTLNLPEGLLHSALLVCLSDEQFSQSFPGLPDLSLASSIPVNYHFLITLQTAETSVFLVSPCSLLLLCGNKLL